MPASVISWLTFFIHTVTKSKYPTCLWHFETKVCPSNLIIEKWSVWFPNLWKKILSIRRHEFLLFTKFQILFLKWWWRYFVCCQLGVYENCSWSSRSIHFHLFQEQVSCLQKATFDSEQCFSELGFHDARCHPKPNNFNTYPVVKHFAIFVNDCFFKHLLPLTLTSIPEICVIRVKK